MGAQGDGWRSGWAVKAGIAEQTVFGTAITATAWTPFATWHMNVARPKSPFKAITGTRDPMAIFHGLKKAEGSIAWDFNPSENFSVLMLKHAMGGTVSSATTPTTTSTGRIHTLYAGDGRDNAGTSTTVPAVALSLYAQYGETVTTAMLYWGCRVNSLSFKMAVGSPLQCTANIVGADGSQTSYNPGGTAFGQIAPMTWAQITVAEADHYASITSATAMKYQDVELTISNEVQSDNKAYDLGSASPSILPFKDRKVTLKMTQRYDTTTNWDKFIQNTISAVRITIDSGITMTADVTALTYAAIIDLPQGEWTAMMPEVGDAGILESKLEYHYFLNLTTSSTPIQMTVRNNTANYW